MPGWKPGLYMGSVGARKKPEAGPGSDIGLLGYVARGVAPLETFQRWEQTSTGTGL